MKIIRKSMKYPSSDMEEDYRSMITYLSKANSHFVYMKTSKGKNKRGLGIFNEGLFDEDESKYEEYAYINSPDEKENSDDELDYVYIGEITVIASIIQYEAHPLEQLRQLHKVTNFAYSSIVYEAVKIAHTLKGMTISISSLQYPHVFSDLGLATHVDEAFSQKIEFLKNPPSLYIGDPPLVFP